MDNTVVRKTSFGVPQEIPRFGTPLILTLAGFMSFFGALRISLFYSSGVFYYVPILKMSIVWQSAAGSLSLLAGIYAAMFIGYYGDRVISRWGKRKPLLAFFYPFVGISAIAIYYCPTSSHSGIQAWYLLCLVTMSASDACFSSVFLSWMIESCTSAQDFINISTVSNVGGALGALLGIVLGGVLHIFGAPIVVAAIGNVIILAVFLYFAPSRVISKRALQPPLLASFRVLSRTFEYRTILLNKIIITAAYNMCGEFLLYICFMCFPGITHYSQIQSAYTVFAVVNVIGTVPVVLTLIFLLGRKWEKINIYMFITRSFVALAALLFFLYLPGLILGDELPASQYQTLFAVWMALIIVATLLFSGAMFCEGLIVRDLIRFDTFRTGLNRENLYQTALNVPAQIGSQIIYSIPMTIFTASGFQQKENPVVTDDLMTSKYTWNYGSQVQIVMYSTVLFGTGALISYYLFYRYPLLQPVADKIETALNKRTLAQESQETRRSIIFGSAKKAGEEEDDADAKAKAEEGQDDQERLSSIDVGLSSIADDKDEMLMNHFSTKEIIAMSNSEHDGNNRNVALGAIRFYHRVNLYFAAPGTLACLFAAMYVQMRSNSAYQATVVNFICLSSFFFLYECLRVQPIADLLKSKGIDVPLKAKAAYRSISGHQETLKEMLDRNGIDAEDKSGKRESLAAPIAATVDVDEALEEKIGGIAVGYARLFSMQAVLAVLGILFATVIVRS